MGVSALAGVSFSLRVYGELAGGPATIPAPITMLAEPFDLAPLVSASGQTGDGLTDGCVPVTALADVEVGPVGLGPMQGGDERMWP